MKTKISISIATLVAGMAAAVALTLPPTAAAYTPDQLPDMGYAVSELNLGNNCHDWKVSGYGASIDLGSDCDAGFQAALDAFVQATYPPIQPTTTTATTATTSPATTTAATTTASTTTAATPPETAPAATTTATTAPADTTAAPTETAPTAAPAPADTTATTTTATAVDPAITSLQQQIDDLKAQLAALTSRVAAIEAYLAAGGFITDTVSSALVAQQTATVTP